MKIKKLWSLLCIAIMLVIPTCIAVAKEGRTDEAPVVISDVTLSEKTLSSGETLKYEVVVKPVKRIIVAQMNHLGCDKVVSIELIWSSSKKQNISRVYKWDGKSKITISDKIVIGKGMQSGKWKLDEIGVTYSGKEDDYAIEVLSDTNKYAHKSDIVVKFPTSEFTVKGTTADNKAPTIDLNSARISKRIIRTAETSVFSVKVKDASRVDNVTLQWNVYNKNSKLYKTVSTKARYNKKTKRYECRVKLGKNQTMKKLKAITTRDVYGNNTKCTFNPNSKTKTMLKMNTIKVALKNSYYSIKMKNADKWPIVNSSSVTKEVYTGIEGKDIYVGDMNVTDKEKPCSYLAYIIKYNDAKPKTIEIYRSTRKDAGFKKVAVYNSYGNAPEVEDGYADFDVETGKTYYYKSRIVEKNGEKTIYSNFSPVVGSKY